MASGISVNDEVVHIYNSMKVRKAGECESDRLKLVLFRVSDDGKEIVVDKGKQIFNRDLKSDEDVFKRVISQFPEKECRYALYDTCYETKESKKEDLVFITWVPDTAAIKSKMLYASSKKALSDKMKGIKFDWQVNELGELKDCACLREVLKAHVVAFEGKPV